MTASVYTGIINGTGADNTTVLYNNTTGGNVRIIWYYMYVGSESGANQKIFIGADGPTDGDIYTQHQNEQYMNTVALETPQQLYLGTNMAIITGNDNVAQNASTASYARFPIEIMLANTHKMAFWTNGGWGNNETALHYNFIAIPE